MPTLDTGHQSTWSVPFASTSRPAPPPSNSKTRRSPNACGHLPDKELVDAAVFEQKLAAALDSRIDDNFLVIARTDARAPLGLDEAIERGNRYARAGADIVFVEGASKASTRSSESPARWRRRC